MAAGTGLLYHGEEMEYVYIVFCRSLDTGDDLPGLYIPNPGAFKTELEAKKHCSLLYEQGSILACYRKVQIGSHAISKPKR